ncbi:uncharacterized protein LOC108339357 [Vigna angularis]|uniref:uncharacterized protein LOC108339357 n=1 Tax=Phaseolus angularis TaxID=3914 RepID=UPI00080A1BAA|nr:uncharacterized protein LOC108339357 [Vigna angularis]
MPEKPPPALYKYDGSIDLDDQLRTFSNAMKFYKNSDPIMCRAFSLSLKEEALEWYNTLPPKTVDCFTNVETLFRRQYAANQRQEITPAELVNTKQEKGETLKAFMKRYTETARRVKDVNHNLSSAICLHAYDQDILLKNCIRNSREKQQHEASADGIRKDGRQSFGGNDKGGDPRPKDFPRTPKFDHYTAVNAPRAKILEEALRTEHLSVRKLHSPKNVDEGKHCQYHQNLGHTTEECVTLKDKIEPLIRAGHLRKYVKEERSQVRNPSRRSPRRSIE